MPESHRPGVRHVEFSYGALPLHYTDSASLRLLLSGRICPLFSLFSPLSLDLRQQRAVERAEIQLGKKIGASRARAAQRSFVAPARDGGVIAAEQDVRHR